MVCKKNYSVVEKKKKAWKTHTKRQTTAYAVRKERQRQLIKQVENMQKELDELKFRLLVEQGEVGKATKRTQAENAILYEIIQKQHLERAAMQAVLTSHVQRSLNSLQPVQSVINLGTDQVERYNTLMDLKERLLENAKRYLAARSHELDPGSNYCQEERFDAPDSDYCVVRFETVPIRGAQANQVFEAILHSVLNAEIFLSEMFGCVAIREDNDFETSEFAQLRMVTETSIETTVESNTLVCSRFVEASDHEDGNYGVIAADFVDSDELYPYRTGERVRRDTTTLVSVRSTPLMYRGSPEVIITRWTCLKIHQFKSRDPETEMAESSVCYGDTAQKCIQQQLVHATTIDSPTP